MALDRDSALTFGMRTSSGSGVGRGRDDARRSIGPQTRKAPIDVVEVMPRVVEGVLEQATYVASSFSNGEAASPRVDAGIVGESSETFSGDAKCLNNLVRIGVGVRHGSGLDQIVCDGREGRFISSQCLLDAVGVERGDVATVRGVLDGRPCVWLGPGAEFGAGCDELLTPALLERSQRVEQRRVGVHGAVEAARLATLMFTRHRTSLPQSTRLVSEGWVVLAEVDHECPDPPRGHTVISVSVWFPPAAMARTSTL